jgi:ribosomal protein S18 acetylase RimI-like enzyme
MARIEYTETSEQGLDLIYNLRQKIIEYHKALSPSYFYRRYAGMDVNRGNQIILEKAIKGYCISTISGDRQGEIESIYIEPDYRGSGIGDSLMKRALRWMDECSVTKKVLGVGAGNEEVFEFYRRYNFYPRTTILEQVETGEGE